MLRALLEQSSTTRELDRAQVLRFVDQDVLVNQRVFVGRCARERSAQALTETQDQRVVFDVELGAFAQLGSVDSAATTAVFVVVFFGLGFALLVEVFERCRRLFFALLTAGRALVVAVLDVGDGLGRAQRRTTRARGRARPR